MVSKETLNKFNSQLATLEILVQYLDRAIKLLKNQQIKTSTEIDDRNKYIIELALSDFIINNLTSLFDNKSKKIISLERIRLRFEKSFPHNFFSEYTDALEKFKKHHKKDLERIEKNRHLRTAHFGGGEEQLGYDRITAQRIDKIFGTKSTIAPEDKFLFITPIDILRMPIFNAVGEIKKILENLNFKLLIIRNRNIPDSS